MELFHPNWNINIGNCIVQLKLKLRLLSGSHFCAKCFPFLCRIFSQNTFVFSPCSKNQSPPFWSIKLQMIERGGRSMDFSFSFYLHIWIVFATQGSHLDCVYASTFQLGMTIVLVWWVEAIKEAWSIKTNISMILTKHPFTSVLKYHALLTRTVLL